MTAPESDSEGYDLEPSPRAPKRPRRESPPSTSPPPSPRPAADMPQRTSTMAQIAYEQRIARKAATERAGRDAARDAYRTPVLMFAIGAAGVCIIQYFAGGGSAVAAYLLSYVVSVPIGVAVYLLCCAIWIGFNEPIHLIALALAGIYAVTDLVLVALGFVPVLGIFAWVISSFVYVGLLSQLLEIELGEAIVVGLATFVAKVLIAIAIVSAVA